MILPHEFLHVLIHHLFADGQGFNHGCNVFGLESTQIEQVPIEDSLDHVLEGDDLRMFVVMNATRYPAVREGIRVRVIDLREQHDDLASSSVLHVAQLSDECVIECHDSLGASVKFQVESARFIETRIRNIKEALVSQPCSLSVEWSLVDGVQVTRILVVDILVQALFTVEMLEYFKGDVVAAIHSSVERWIISSTAPWWIVLIICLDIVWISVDKIINPGPCNITTERFKIISCLHRQICFDYVISSSRVHEYGLILNAIHLVLCSNPIRTCEARSGTRSMASIDRDAINGVIEHGEEI